MRSHVVYLLAAVVSLPAAAAASQAQDAARALDAVRSVAEKAYLFFYPLVLMETTRGTAVNELTHNRELMDDRFRQVVRPNADTLYSMGRLDLSKEPMLLHVPDTHGRYYVVQLLDAWTETFAAPGKRTTGTAEGWFAIAGPGWSGTLPPGVTRIDSPTRLVWVIGRIQVNGPADLDHVHGLQDGFRLVPLRAWPAGSAAPGPLDRLVPEARDGGPPPVRVQQMSALDFLRAGALLLKREGAHAEDGPMLRELETIGIRAGESFHGEGLGPEKTKAIEEGVAAAANMLAEVARQQAVSGAMGRNGWSLPGDVGRYGTDYARRAVTARTGLGALPAEDAIYLSCRADEAGEPFDGRKQYVIHFAEGQAPPAHAFWSLTLYDEQGYFTANPIGRFAIGDRDALTRNKDGSLDIQVGHEPPGEAGRSNWLPAPAGPFNLMLRLYWPDEAAVNGRWTPPAVTRSSPR